ncbi:3'-5' exoribonuclease HELZ2-like isoform X2 [Babylonia areolata]
MDQGRESPPDLSDDQQTTGAEWGGSTADSSENSSDSSETGEMSAALADLLAIANGHIPTEDVDILYRAEDVERLYAEFRESVEVFFSRAEDTITSNRFDLACAKDLVLRVRDVGERYSDKGCEEVRLEEMVVNRALTTVDRLVDGVQTNEEELFDPRQTMTYLYSAMGVFPSTFQLGRGSQSLVYHMSSAGSASLSQIGTLTRYCGLKTLCEREHGFHNTTVHERLLLDLAEWLEGEGRAPVTYLITSRTIPVIARMLEAGRQNGLVADCERLLRLWDLGVLLATSALVRTGFIREAGDNYRHLMKVDPSRLPRALSTRYSYVYGCLLQNCGQYAKALDHANDALRGVMDAEERRDIERLIHDVNEAMKQAVHQRDLRGPADHEWLDGTNAKPKQVRREQLETNRHSHTSRKEAKGKRTRTVSFPKRGETPSPAPSGCGLRTRGPKADTLTAIRNRSTSASTSNLSLYSSSPASSGTSFAEQARTSSAVFSSRESLLFSSEWDESDDDDEEGEDSDRDIRFFYSSDEDDNFKPKPMGGSEESPEDWFKKSEQAIAEGKVDEEEGEDFELSSGQANDFERGGEGRVFYPDFHRDAGELLIQDPARYKRCQLKIERAHKAIAKVLDKDCKYTEILIDGRSKAGRTYMDDEVVVEVLAEPGGSGGIRAEESVDKMVYGQVVGLLKRVNFAYNEHPVFFCTMDELEGHLMRPLCKTVPKIHVMNDTVKRKYPTLTKNRIEIKRISADGRVHHKKFCDVRPDKREQYVFKVVLLSWRQRNIYPLGAVLEAHIGGQDYSGGLEVLSMQQRVPKCYPRAAVEDVKKIVQGPSLSKRGREDLTAERLFTIDPPGSKDLDDAISIRTEGPHVVIGVHIADVAAVVKKGSGLDLEARRRAVTFYPLQRQPHCMLPEPLSHGKCSLLPGQERLAFSVFFRFNQKGKQVADPEVKRTVIKSRQQLTYEEAQKVIDGDRGVNVEPSIQDDIRQIHRITAKLREGRQKLSVFFVPFEDPRLPELEQLNECLEAHALIEELMVLTNSYIASRLNKRPRYRDCMIVRCHKAPTYEDLAEWQEKEGHVTNLVMSLQGKQVTPGSRLSVENPPPVRAFPSQPRVLVQRQVWEKLCRHLERGEGEEARTLAFMDALHPLQCLANNSWLDMMETAEYRCAYGLNSPQLRHFGLSLDVYTHFTSPIRRYADLHVQRLLHADLDGRSADCDPNEVTELCQHINSATSRQKAFGKGCMSLKVADNLQRQPLVFRAYVDAVDNDQLTVFVPSLHKLSDRKQELPFSVLGVSSQPEVVTDTARNQQSVTVQWNRRFYDEKGTCPTCMIPVWKYLERMQRNAPRAPVVMTLCPDLLSVWIRQAEWAGMLQTLVSNPELPWSSVPQPVSRGVMEVEYMSSEKGDGSVSQRPVQFQRTYTRGQVVQVQMSAEPRRGMLKPRTDILHTARNACMCTQHVSEPVRTLTRHATRPTRDQQFSSYQGYMKAWMPLMEMEAAVGAGEGESSVVIDNVHVTLKAQAPSSDLPFRGSFSLKAAFCYKRGIEFGGTSAESIREDSTCSNADMSFPLDYLCLRHKADCSSGVLSRVKGSQVGHAVERTYTWLAHASVVQVVLKGKKREDGGELVVTFVLSPSSPPPPPELLQKGGARVSMEVLPKAAVDRRAQELLVQLQDTDLTLARAVAFGNKFPKMDPNHKKLGEKDENHEVIGPPTKRLPRNNLAQLEAIKKALTKTVSMIQGPPGSGKTNTGIKLVYLFCKINRQLQEEGKGKKTVLYCGPSNKSVDLVARELKNKLGPEFCPKIVRVYGSAIEAKDYPVPRGDLKTTRGLRDLCTDPDLQDVALHHLIRQDDKPFAEDIAEFEKFFDKCRQDPDKHSVTDRQLRKYYRLLHDASVEELKHYEVVLATCAVGGNRRVVGGIRESVFQLIIDECAMSPEPQSLVPIVATTPQQVVLIGDHKQLRPIIKCQAAAELGLDQSLFERLFQKFPDNTTFLDTQYRMHPEICAFPSREFYEGGLKTGYSTLWGGELLPLWPSDPMIPKRQVPHLLINVCGEEEMLTVNTDQGNERSKSNSLEAEKVIEIIKFLKREHKVDLLKVKVLTQYNAQRHLLEEKLKEAIRDNMNIFEHYDKFKVKVSTVVSSQGGEWDYVILSTVRSLPTYKIEQNPTHGWCRSNLGFITDRNQVNVALTRARRGLFIVGNVKLLHCDDVWRHLVERYQRLGCCVDDPALFPPPPAPRIRHRQRHVQHTATGDWQRV